LLHELGHSTYTSKYIPATLPYALRSDAHALSTEAVAMMFEDFAGDAGWLRAMGVTVPDPEKFDRQAAMERQAHRLIFSRWCQVMFRFEKELYADPDQDLNKLWWDLVEKYQEIKRPEGSNEPDYAAKIHIVSAPVYYHNYMLGELFAAQLRQAIAREVQGGADRMTPGALVGNKALGRFMRERVYQPGRSVDWEQLSVQATGGPLGAKAFAKEIKE
jgi:peptidyl-dipeptidase A